MLQRVQKIIANAGICSRRKAEELIKQGKVAVNGKAITIGTSADPLKDSIICDGKKVGKLRKVYLAFNKPPDCLTTLDDPRGRKTIFSYIKSDDRLIPVGRLDFKTEGLLFLTNDGDFANNVMHPRYEVEKTYIVALDKTFPLEDMKRVKEGIMIDINPVTDVGEAGDARQPATFDEFRRKSIPAGIKRFKTLPAKIRYCGPEKNMIEITIHQGQNRVVRRMMETLGYRVLRLIRTKVGNVQLGSLQWGKTREMSFNEIRQFMR